MANRMNISAFNMERNSTMMTIVAPNGEVRKITFAQWQKERKAQKRAMEANKKKIAVKTEIQLLPTHIERMIKSIKTIKSLASYYNNAYRQWGLVAKHIIDSPFIAEPFLRFRMVAYDISAILDDIKKIGKENDKAIFQYIEKLSYKIDDAKNRMLELTKGVRESNVCEIYSNKECINGEGRRLGLSILMTRSLLSINDMEELFKELGIISKNGLDVMEYCHINGKRITD